MEFSPASKHVDRMDLMLCHLYPSQIVLGPMLDLPLRRQS